MVERFSHGYRAPLQAIGERFSLHQLQHERPKTFGFLDTVDRADVWMIQGGEHPRFALESREAIRDRWRRARGRILIATSRPSFVSRAR